MDTGTFNLHISAFLVIWRGKNKVMATELFDFKNINYSVQLKENYCDKHGYYLLPLKENTVHDFIFVIVVFAMVILLRTH